MAKQAKPNAGESKASQKTAKPEVPKHPLMLDGKDWNRDLVMNHICDQLATTSLGIGSILKAGYAGNNLPSYSTVMKWLEENEKLSERYTRGKEAQADFMADEILDIADNASNDWMERHDKDGGNTGWQLNGEHVQRSRLRIESRKWLAAKLKPKKYGERTTLAGDAENPVAVLTMSSAERDARIEELLAKSAKRK